MRTTDKEAAAREAVTDAWDFWLSQHPISLQEMIEAAITTTFDAWLHAHSDEILDRLARRTLEPQEMPR